MTANSFAANALEVLLGWFKSLVNGIWALFSGTGGSLLTWLSNSWLPLLIVFLVIGMAMDMLVYLLRWRPYWWWFSKRRLVVDDRLFSAPRGKNRPKPRRVEPSTKVPVRVTRYHEEEPTNDAEDDLFMDQSLFDVKSTSERHHSSDLYAPSRRPRENARRRKNP